MNPCPICTTEATQRLPYPVYWLCPNCGCGFQDPQPPKLYIGDVDPADMGEDERRINRELAAGLFKNVMRGVPGTTIDVGARLPVLAQALGKETGCLAFAIDPAIVPMDGVEDVPLDFESTYLPLTQFALVTAIHFFEHCYDPKATLRKMRAMVADGGHLFLRLPQHDVQGIERDYTEDHSRIHPFVHCFQSMLELCQQTGVFKVVAYQPMPPYGQADYTLEPL